MHDPVIQNLEAYLEGRHVPELESHIRSCAECQEELAMFATHSSLLHTLRVEEQISPNPGFYARVSARIESQTKPSFWDLLLDPIFGRRLVYASTALVLLMSGFLMLSPMEQRQMASAPERLLVAPQSMAVMQSNEDADHDRNVVLVDMVSYSQAD
jgi:hypothetical protein